MKKKLTKKKSDPQVVVITGASSGNGRAAAIEFAKSGARLVLAARNIKVLIEVARECQRLGATAIAVKTDVTQYAEVQSLVDAALEEFGRVDVWINNAGIGAVGKLNQTPIATHRHVVDTNLLGPIHGTHAILPHFLERKRGIFINTNSLGTWVPMPYASSYTASKFGLRGFLEALRSELSDEPDIHICEIFPAFVRSPGIAHAANHVGRKLANPPGAGDPRHVARQMLKLARQPRERQMIMGMTRLGRVAYFLMPHLVRWTLNQTFKAYLKRAHPVPESEGNVFRPSVEPMGITAQASP